MTIFIPDNHHSVTAFHTHGHHAARTHNSHHHEMSSFESEKISKKCGECLDKVIDKCEADKDCINKNKSNCDKVCKDGLNGPKNPRKPGHIAPRKDSVGSLPVFSSLIERQLWRKTFL